MRFASCNRTGPVFSLLAMALLAGCGGFNGFGAAKPAPVSEPTNPPPIETKTAPAAAKAAFQQAVADLEAGNLEAANRSLIALTREYPQLAGPWTNLGIVYMRSGRLQEARSALEEAVRLNPRMAAAHNQLGILHRQAGRFDAAERAYRAALAADPDYSYAHLNLGVLYDVYLRRPAQALEHYQRYEQLAKDKDEKVAIWIADLKRRL